MYLSATVTPYAVSDAAGFEPTPFLFKKKLEVTLNFTTDLCSGGRTRTDDLKVMSLASYQLLPPRNVCCPARIRTSILWTKTRCAAVTPQDNLRSPTCQRTIRLIVRLLYHNFKLCFFFRKIFARVERFELPSTVLETGMLPLHHTRVFKRTGCGGGTRTHVVQLMRLSWNLLQSTPQFVFRCPTRIRTWDPLIKSEVLYQLSYKAI